MLSEPRKKDLEKQGYRLAGNHSAVKACTWCKKSLRDEDVCYKEVFYDTKSHRCVQMTPSLFVCTHRCVWCWRDIDHTDKEWSGPIDEPKDIVDQCIAANTKYLKGFGGNKKSNMKKYKEIDKPQQFAISLSGEPTFYPRLPDLVDELKKRKINSFLVTNGTNPDMLKKLIGKHEPTQLYITLPAPNEKIYKKCCSPLIKDGWQKIMESLSLLSKFKCRKAIRLTLVKYENMLNPEEYAEILKNIDADYFEFKAYMWVGYSKKRLAIENMPSHSDIKEFAEKVSKLAGLKITKEKKESRVVLAVKS